MFNQVGSGPPYANGDDWYYNTYNYSGFAWVNPAWVNPVGEIEVECISK